MKTNSNGRRPKTIKSEKEELVDKVSNEDDGDTEHGTVSGHDAVWGDGFYLGTLHGEEEIHEEGDTPEGQDELHEQHNKDGGEVPGVLGADHGRVRLDHRAPDVENNVEITEEVEVITKHTIVDDQQCDKKQDEDDLVKDDKLLNNLSSKTVCEKLNRLHLEWMFVSCNLYILE